MLFLFAGLLLSLFVYSYALIDPNLTLVNAPWWVLLRDPLVYFGYYQRHYSVMVYILLSSLLFVFHWYFVKGYKKYSVLHLVGLISIILVLSYPFLSHDLFNYIFDAKIFTFYGDNPYSHIPGNYPDDLWLRFMHWTHRTYPYGPVFLPLTIIASFLAFGKFILNFIFFKAMFVGFYFLGVFSLLKINKRSAMVFATHPLILIEGLVNTHNDLIGVAIALWGLYYLHQSNKIKARAIVILSAGIKYLTFPVILLRHKHIKWNYGVLTFQILLIVFLGYLGDLQPWYFLTFFAYLPVFPKLIDLFGIFSFGLLISYYPLINYGSWGDMHLKYWIMGTGFVLNICYLFMRRYYLKK